MANELKVVGKNTIVEIVNLERKDAVATGNQFPFRIKVTDRKKEKNIRYYRSMQGKELSGGNSTFVSSFIKDDIIIYPTRYQKLLSFFKSEKYSKIVPYITHLYISFDTVYYIYNMEGKKSSGSFVYLPEYTMEQKGLMKYRLSNIYRKEQVEININQAFQVYKNCKTPEAEWNLRNAIKKYAEVRLNSAVFSNNTPFIHIFDKKNKENGLNFRSLEYLYLNRSYDNTDFDFHSLEDTNLKKIISLEDEKNEFIVYKSQGAFEDISSKLKRVLYVDSIKSLSSFEILVKEVISDNNPYINNENNILYSTKKAEKEYNDKRKEIEAEEKKKSAISEKLIFIMKDIVVLVKDINVMFNNSDFFSKEMEAYNKPEYLIWGKDYKADKIKTLINMEHAFELERKVLNSSDKIDGAELKWSIYEVLKYCLSIPIFQKYALTGEATDDVDSKKNLLTLQDIEALDSVLPYHFKDNRRTIESMGLEIKTLEGLGNFEKVLKEICNSLMCIYQMLIALQYALFCQFLKRFGTWGIPLSLSLLPSLLEYYKTNRVPYSKNVLEIANRFFYLLKVKDSNLVDYSVEKRNKELGNEWTSFVKNSLDILDGTGEALLLTHTGKESAEHFLFENLQEEEKLVEKILEAYSMVYIKK